MSKKSRLKLIPSQEFTPAISSPLILDEKLAKTKIKATDLKCILPLTDNQNHFFNQYQKDKRAFLLHGVAGTGKTYIALYNAFKEIFEKNSPCQKVIIVRSAVPSRDIGHLPGDEKEKTEVYTQPYVDICSELFPRFGPSAFNRLREQKALSFMVTSFVRGLTVSDSIIIVDEAQNMTDMELNSIMTRIGQNTKIIFCGDFRQTDLYKKNDMSGLKKFISITDHMPSFVSVEFGVEDICRSNLVKEYIIARMTIEDMMLVS